MYIIIIIIIIIINLNKHTIQLTIVRISLQLPSYTTK